MLLRQTSDTCVVGTYPSYDPLACQNVSSIYKQKTCWMPFSVWWSSQHRVPNHNVSILYEYDTYTGFPAFAGDYRTLHWVSFQADDDLSIFNSPICAAIYVEKHVGSIFVKQNLTMTSRFFLIDLLIQTPSLDVVADVERFHIVCQQGIASRLG